RHRNGIQGESARVVEPNDDVLTAFVDSDGKFRLPAGGLLLFFIALFPALGVIDTAVVVCLCAGGWPPGARGRSVEARTRGGCAFAHGRHLVITRLRTACVRE